VDEEGADKEGEFGIVAELPSVVDYDVLEKGRKFGGPPSESDLSH